MTNDKMTLRNNLVDIALEWQDNFGVAPVPMNPMELQ